MSPSSAGALHVVKTTAAILEVPLPEGLVTRIETANTLVTAAESIDGSPARLHEAVLDAISEGRSYHSDKQVSRLLVDHLLASHGLAGAAARRAESDTATALVAHADALLAGWASALGPHGVVLTEAARVLQSDDLDDVATPTGQGPAALGLWLDARAARELFDAGVDGAMALAPLAGCDTASRHHRTLAMVGPDLDVLDQIPGRRVDAWQIARAGLTPALIGSLNEYRHRAGLLAQQRADVLAAEQQRQQHPRKVNA